MFCYSPHNGSTNRALRITYYRHGIRTCNTGHTSLNHESTEIALNLSHPTRITTVANHSWIETDEPWRDRHDSVNAIFRSERKSEKGSFAREYSSEREWNRRNNRAEQNTWSRRYLKENDTSMVLLSNHKSLGMSCIHPSVTLPMVCSCQYIPFLKLMFVSFL